MLARRPIHINNQHKAQNSYFSILPNILETDMQMSKDIRYVLVSSHFSPTLVTIMNHELE